MAQSITIRGGGRVEYRGTKYYAKGNITIDFEVVTKADENLNFNEPSVNDTAGAKVKFQPVGQLANTDVTNLYHILDLEPGDSLFDGTNYPLVIHGKDGIKYTFANAVVSNVPSLNFKNLESILGEVEFTCRHSDFAWAAADSLYTRAAAAYPTDDATYYDPDEILKQCFKITWGFDDPGYWLSAAGTKDGIVVDFQASLEDDENDCNGLTGIFLTGLTATAKAKLIGTPTYTAGAGNGPERAPEWMNLQGVGKGRGTKPYTDTLTINSSDDQISFELRGAFIEKTGMEYSRKDPRFGETQWKAEGTGGVYPVAVWDSLL